MSPLDNDIRPDRKIETGRHDPEFTRKLAAVKKEPMDHIVALDRRSGQVNVFSFGDTFQARDYQTKLPKTLVSFEDPGDPQAGEAQVQGFVRRVEGALEPYDPEPHLQMAFERIRRLRQEMEDLGNMNLRRFLLDRLDEVENEARRLTQPGFAGDFERRTIPLRQSLWALDALARLMLLKDVVGFNPPYSVWPEPQWPIGQPVPPWNRELAPVIESMRSQPSLPNHRRMELEIRETVATLKFVLDHLAQNPY